jgi:hypothetical protein
VEQAFAEIRARLGHIDILVNAAGVLSTGLVADLPVTEWQRIARSISPVSSTAPEPQSRRCGRRVLPHHQHRLGIGDARRRLGRQHALWHHQGRQRSPEQEKTNKQLEELASDLVEKQTDLLAA